MSFISSVLWLLFSFYFQSDGQTYFIGDSVVGWDTAQSYCNGLGNDLASISSDTEYNEAKALCQTKDNSNTYGCWIGLTKESGSWEWTDGSPLSYGFDSNENPTTGVYPWIGTDPNGDGPVVNLHKDAEFRWIDGMKGGGNWPICNSQSSTTGWISPAPTMDPEYHNHDFQMGIWQNMIYLIPNGESVYVLFDPMDETFTSMNSNSMTAPSADQAYGSNLQFGNILYYTTVTGDQLELVTFDLSTNQMISNSIPHFRPAYQGVHNAANIPNNGCRRADENYIYIVGGYYSNSFTLFDVSANEWYDGPTMNAQRYDGSCAVAPNGKLYGIGGWSGGGETTVETISTTNVLSNSWVYIGDQFPQHTWGINAVVYDTDIYVMGGADTNDGSPKDLVYIIDTTTDTISLSPDRLAFPNYGASEIVFDNAIYLFGGYSGANGQWQMLRVAPSLITTEYIETTLAPTESPIHPVCTVEELDWDALITDGVSQTSLSLPSILSSWDAATLQFSIDITLDYITRSKYTFIDQYDNDRGVTYVIDTEPFLSDGRYLDTSNNCENRESASFVGKDWNTEYWSYLDQTNGLNSENYLEYGPTNTWTLNWDIECETITYSNVFLFNQLLGCVDKDGASTFTFIEDANWLNLTGAFYITLVSPLINQNDIAQSTIDIGQYLTNTIGNYPISISFPKTIASIRDPGVILFDISIFAIQYDEQNSKLLVDILSYTAQYINLINVNVMTPMIGIYQTGVVNSITINEDDSYSGTECLFETNFRCFQKFQIEIDLSSCPLTSIDLSTTILLDVEPTCRNGEDCTLFRSEFGAIGTTTQLTESLSYTESCDTQIYIQTFEGTIKYFIDMGFTNEVDETTEFSIGSTLYVDVSVNDIGAYGVFSIHVLNVWICTTSAIDLSITSQLTGEGGCIQNYASNNAQASNIDEIYQAFKDGIAYDSSLNGQIYQSVNDESVRFSLIIPSFQRNKFWLHAIVEMTLENNVRRRARLLLTTSNNLDGNTVNRLSHYIKDVSIVNDNIKTTHSVNNTEKEETDSSVSYYYSYFVYIICTFIIAFC